MARALYCSLIVTSSINIFSVMNYILSPSSLLINQAICSQKPHIAGRFRTLVLNIKLATAPPT